MSSEQCRDRLEAHIDDALATYARPVPEAAFGARLEQELLGITRARGRKTHRSGRGWAVAAAALVAAGVLAALWLPGSPPATPRIPIQVAGSPTSSDERRLAMSELLEKSDLVLAGQVQAEKHAKGDFVFEVCRVVKGRSEGARLALAHLPAIGCPEPPTFHPGVWAILFLHQGVVPTDQWKLEFTEEEEMQRFVARLQGYLDGSILATLRRELAAGGGVQPFGEADRLLLDIRGILRARRDVRGLVELAKRHRKVALLDDIAELGGPEAGEFLSGVRRPAGWSVELEVAAISRLGRVGKEWIGEDVLCLLSSAEVPHAYRLAAIRAVGDARDVRGREALLTIWRDVPDKAEGPAGAKGTPKVKGARLKRAALRAIGALRDPRDRDLLVEVLRGADDWHGYRGDAADALADCGDREAIPALRETLRDPETSAFSRARIEAALSALEQGK